MTDMTNTAPSGGRVPEFEMRHRMRLALEHAGVKIGQMAEYLECDRNTVGNWLSGRAAPRPSDIKLWALRCGVSYMWLKTGIDPNGDGGPTAITDAVTDGYPESKVPSLTDRRAFREDLPSRLAA